ncbi:MAG TPA: hypothetical protein VOA41_01310 [Candidatus Dormibacteraeota bacterium]|nr:hypothetical protein [Candidatus Dormibacteraeota bacterium]
MIEALSSSMRGLRFGGLAFLLLGLGGAYVVANWIVTGTSEDLILRGLAIATGVILLLILKNWRSGFYFFLLWLLFEDLARKYMGNNMLIYFAKDFLVGIVYVSFFMSLRRHKAEGFHPRFIVPLILFFGFGVIQVFNPGSPNVLFGLLGLKIYFYYVPLMFVGYALADTEKNLQKFLTVNLSMATVIAVLGVIQAIRGSEFLNPTILDENIRGLATLKRYAPTSGQFLYRPTSVFVSDGRFASYLILMWLVGFGAAGYLLLRTKGGRKLTFVSLGAITTALLLSGSRGGVMWTAGSALICISAFLWGAPWKKRKAHQIIKIIHSTSIVCGLGLIVMISIFPQDIGARLSFYSETLSPYSPNSELSHRVGGYPIKELLTAFQDPRWPYGYGIGTASLGGQYVRQWLHITPPTLGVESGFGTLVVELGILGLVLWIVWTVTLLLAAWRVVRRLKGSPYFPIAFSIFWFAFLLLLLFTYTGMQAFQNYVLNAYLWLLVGVLFRLPHLAAQQIPQR